MEHNRFGINYELQSSDLIPILGMFRYRDRCRSQMEIDINDTISPEGEYPEEHIVDDILTGNMREYVFKKVILRLPLLLMYNIIIAIPTASVIKSGLEKLL